MLKTAKIIATSFMLLTINIAFSAIVAPEVERSPVESTKAGTTDISETGLDVRSGTPDQFIRTQLGSSSAPELSLPIKPSDTNLGTGSAEGSQVTLAKSKSDSSLLSKFGSKVSSAIKTVIKKPTSFIKSLGKDTTTKAPTTVPVDLAERARSSTEDILSKVLQERNASFGYTDIPAKQRELGMDVMDYVAESATTVERLLNQVKAGGDVNSGTLNNVALNLNRAVDRITQLGDLPDTDFQWLTTLAQRIEQTIQAAKDTAYSIGDDDAQVAIGRLTSLSRKLASYT